MKLFVVDCVGFTISASFGLSVAGARGIPRPLEGGLLLDIQYFKHCQDIIDRSQLDGTTIVDLKITYQLLGAKTHEQRTKKQ